MIHESRFQGLVLVLYDDSSRSHQSSFSVFSPCLDKSRYIPDDLIITPLPWVWLGMTPEDVATDYYGVHSSTAYRVSPSQHSLIVLCTPYHELFQMISRRQRNYPFISRPAARGAGSSRSLLLILPSLSLSLSPTALFLWCKISEKAIKALEIQA